MLDIRQHPMKSLLSVCPSVCSSIHSSLSFLKIGSLVFSVIIHEDSWLWHLVTDRARFLKKKKKNWQSQFGPNGPKSGPKLDFCHFLKLGSLVCLEIAYNDSLQQFLTSSRGKIHKKDLGPRFVPKGPSRTQKYNHFHNTLRLFNVLPNFPFSTSELMCDYHL